MMPRWLIRTFVYATLIAMLLSTLLFSVELFR